MDLQGYILQLFESKSFDKMGLLEDHSMRKEWKFNPLSEERNAYVPDTNLLKLLKETSAEGTGFGILNSVVFSTLGKRLGAY